MASPSRSSKEKTNPNPIGSKSLKHPNPEVEPSLQLSLMEITPSTKNGSSSPSLPTSTHGGLGSLAQKQSCFDSERSDCTNKGCTNGDVGLVRRGSKQGLETRVSDHPSQCKDRKSAIGSPDIGSGTKSLVEVPHRFTTDHREGS